MRMNYVIWDLGCHLYGQLAMQRSKNHFKRTKQNFGLADNGRKLAQIQNSLFIQFDVCKCWSLPQETQ